MTDEPADSTLLDRLIELVWAEMSESRSHSGRLSSQQERLFLDAVSERVENALEIGPDLIQSFWRDSMLDLRKLRADREREAANIGYYYGHALDLFELQVAFATDILNYILSRLDGNQASALAVASAQGIDAAFDIHSLLTSGRSRGAYVRWRTCHEAAVSCTLLVEFGLPACDRYVAQVAVDNFKEMKQYQAAQPRLHVEPYTESELAEARDLHDSALLEYPELRHRSYGWLKAFLDDPSFREQERVAGLDHLRPYYILASHHGHAGPKGGVLLQTQHREFVLGPSASGIVESLSLASGSINVLVSQLVSPHLSGSEERPEPDRFACTVAVLVLAELYKTLSDALEACWAAEQDASG